jgi:hypothetical protein
VVNLREKDYKTFMSRRDGRYKEINSANTTQGTLRDTIQIAFW